MFKFDEEKTKSNVVEILNHVEEFEKAADELAGKNIKTIFLVGIGGTYATAAMVEATFKNISKIPLYLENAADIASVGNAQLGENSLVIVASMSGNTPELDQAIIAAKEKNAFVLGFIDIPDCRMASLVSLNFAFPGSSYGKLSVLLAAILHAMGSFSAYEKYLKAYAEMGDAMVRISKEADDKARAFAEKHWNDPILYVTGAGNLWGSAYTLAMCYMEEMLWMHTKSVSCADFFHGTLEVIEKSSNLLVLAGEDAAREQALRVVRFANTVCDNVEVFDTADYAIPEIDGEMRAMLAPMIIQAVYLRIVANLEDVRKHPAEIRRYYHRLTY